MKLAPKQADARFVLAVADYKQRNYAVAAYELRRRSVMEWFTLICITVGGVFVETGCGDDGGCDDEA